MNEYAPSCIDSFMVALTGGRQRSENRSLPTSAVWHSIASYVRCSALYSELVLVSSALVAQRVTSLEFLNQEAEPSGTTLVDSCNGFNELSRLSVLWTVQHRWPAGARFAFNCYKHWAQLLLRQPG